jgi:hypothetical protein
MRESPSIVEDVTLDRRSLVKKSEIIEKIVEVVSQKDAKPTTLAFAFVNAAIKG